MIRTPRAWREAAGLSAAEMARQLGLPGKNPVRTYRRYEDGAQQCPAEIVEAVRRLSNGRVRAEHWHRVRLAHLQRTGGRR